LVGVWLLSIYVLSTAFPESFDLGLGSSAGIITFAVNAVFFFVFFLVLTAFTERSKKRRLDGPKNQKKDKPGARAAVGPDAAEDEEAEPGHLRGRRNPNTSRRKTGRRRRR
jgi:predicted RND superfamily exporter protein